MKKSVPTLLISSTKDDADIHYICGIHPPETGFLLKTRRKYTLIVSEMEKTRFQRIVYSNVDVIYPAEIGVKKSDGLSQWALQLLKTKDLNEVNVTSGFPVGIADFLCQKGIKINILKESLCPQREIKKEKEIKAIQQSQRAAVRAMKAAIQQIASAEILKNGMLSYRKNNLTSKMVRATIGHVLLDVECITEEIIVAGGPLSADPHERGTGPLYAGQPIVIDIFPKSGKTGYWGDITRTVCRGPAPIALKKQYNAVKAAQAAQLKSVKSGIWMNTIHKIGVDLMRTRGFKTEILKGTPQGFIHGTGHGVGLEIHEAPRVSSVNHQKLRAGHVITIEPGLYYPETGGVRIEDTVAVTKEGFKMLAPCIKKLEI